MKLSFFLAPKSQSKKLSVSSGGATTSDAAKAFESSRPNNNASITKEFVTEFDPSKPSSQTLIIPPKPNSYRPLLKKMRNLELPLTEVAGSDSHPLQFELESASNDVEQAPGSMLYGLNIRQSSGANGNAASRVDPMLIKYKEDIESLPDVPGFEEFDDMPVEGFGAALLAGYGWKEGRGIGRNAKEDVKIIECKKWTGKEGLGFQSEAPVNVTNGNKDSRVESDTGRRGEKEARVVDGSSSRERRDKGRENISSSRRSDRDGRDEEFKDSRKRERNHRGSEDVEKQSMDALKEARAVNGREGSRNSRERRDRTRASSRRSDKDDREHRGSEQVEKQSKDLSERGHQQSIKSERLIWLFTHIRVRVISEAVKGGKLYLKKGEVVDVVGSSCDVLMDESSELVQGVSQEYLETALPKRGGPVLVLYGKHKGVYGSLVEKDSDKETGVVRDADNHEMFNVRLEQIAEFVGDPSYIGY